MRWLWFFLIVSSALASENPCPSLFATPTPAELALSSEERVVLLYSRLLTQYRGSLSSDAEYVKFLETALNKDSYFTISTASASHYDMKELFQRIHEMRANEVLPTGEKLSGSKIDKEIRKYLDAELKALRKAHEVLEGAIDKVKEVLPPFRVLQGHEGAVKFVQVSSDFKQAISFSHDRSLIVWDLKSGAVLHRLTGHSKVITALKVSSDFKRALSASEDGSVIVWDLETGKRLKTFVGDIGPVISIQVRSDFKQAVSTASNGQVIHWDLETGKELSRNNWGYYFHVSADFKVGIRTRVDSLVAFNLETGETLRVLYSGSSNFIQMSPDYRKAVVGAGSGITVWNFETGTKIQLESGHLYMVKAIKVNYDFNRVISASSDKVVISDLETGKVLQELKAPKGESVEVVELSDDGKLAVTASDQHMILWSVETGKELVRLKGHSQGVSAVQISKDLKQAVSSSRDRSLIVWDLEFMELIP